MVAVSEALKRLTQVTAHDVPCPTCGAGRRKDEYDHFRRVNCRSSGAPISSSATHGARQELARKVRGILRAHFTVAEAPCTGEAHSNPHIDNCLICAPRWGTVEYLVPLKRETVDNKTLECEQVYFVAVVGRGGREVSRCKHYHGTITQTRGCAVESLQEVGSSIALHVEIRRRDGAELNDAEAALVENLLG